MNKIDTYRLTASLIVSAEVAIKLLTVTLLIMLIIGTAQMFTKSWYPGDHNVQQLTDVQNGYVCWYTPFAIDCYPQK